MKTVLLFFKCYNYFNHNLIFEGEHNGKGKENDDIGKLKFEGEYSKGKKWNGKGYDKNGNIDYEITNGKGNIKEYNDKYDYLEYKGGYLNGEINGKGKKYNFEGNLVYEGEYLKEERNGKGKKYY